MIYKIAICDDDIEVVKSIKEHLHSYEFKYDKDLEISTFTNGTSLLASYTNPGTYHVLFLDVEMPDINGIDLANKIRQLPDHDVFIIFVSSYPEYMKDSFNVQAFQYLTKPVSAVHLYTELTRAINYFRDCRQTQLIITSCSEEEVILNNDIIYIENLNSKKKILKVVTKNNTIEAIGTISEYEKQLTDSNFMVPSQGFIINLKHVHYIQKKTVIMNNNDSVPLSRRNIKRVQDYFNEQLLLSSIHR